jgi:hypothetical protein
MMVRSKRITLERYQTEYEVEYQYNDGELEINCIDGTTEIESIYSDSFIRWVEDEVKEFTANSKDDDSEYDDSEYDDYFQNQ